jgi:hypothetical protein
MQIRYQISEDDFAAAAALCQKKLKRSLRFLQLIGGVSLVFLGYSIWIGTASLRSWPGGVLPALMFVLPFWITYQFRRVYRNSTALQEPRTMTADSTGVHFESPSVNAQVAWSNYFSFVEDKQSFALLQQGKQIFVPIPKRELTPAQIDELRSLFEQHIARK